MINLAPQWPTIAVSGVGITSLMIWLLVGGLLVLFLLVALLSRSRAFRRMERQTHRESKIDPWSEAANRLRLRDDDSAS